MQDLQLFILKQIKEIDMKVVASIITAILGLLSIVYKGKTNWRRAKDAKQDKALTAHEELLLSIKDSVSSIELRMDTRDAKLDEIALYVSKLKAEKELADKINKLAQDIIDIGDNFIATTDLDTPIKSLIIEGCIESSKFFTNIIRQGIDNVDRDTVKIKAKALLRKLRGQYKIETAMDESVSNAIKTSVAEPLIWGLISKLERLKKQEVEGKIDIFIPHALEFVEAFITNSLGYLTNK